MELNKRYNLDVSRLIENSDEGLCTLQFNFLPESMKESNSSFSSSSNLATVLINTGEEDNSGIVLKGSISSSNNDTLLIYNENDENFELYPVALSVHGLKRDRQDNFKVVKEMTVPEPRTAAQLLKRMKNAKPKTNKARPLSSQDTVPPSFAYSSATT